jgi:hypothetical protein
VAVGVLAFSAVALDMQQPETLPSRTAGGGKVPEPGRALGTGAPVNAGEARFVPGDAEERWVLVTEAMAALMERVTALEGRLAAIEPASPVETDEDVRSFERGGMDQESLVAAGVDAGTAAEIMRRQSRLDMQRLELRDQASREGWLDSERFIEELRKMGGDAVALREEIGDDAYDRFLYLTGQPNRVVVASVIDGSPAQLAGVEAGDLVLDYADSRVFAYADLRAATRAGERGEYVLVRVQRGATTLELPVPRGPLGIRLQVDQVDPDAGGRTLSEE